MRKPAGKGIYQLDSGESAVELTRNTSTRTQRYRAFPPIRAYRHSQRVASRTQQLGIVEPERPHMSSPSAEVRLISPTTVWYYALGLNGRKKAKPLTILEVYNRLTTLNRYSVTQRIAGTAIENSQIREWPCKFSSSL